MAGRTRQGIQQTPVFVDTNASPGFQLPFRLRVEDVLLFLWLVLQPLVFPAPTSGSGSVPGIDPLGGLFDLVGLCGAAACIAARRRDATQTGLIQGGDVAYAVGPLFGAVAFAGRIASSGSASPVRRSSCRSCCRSPWRSLARLRLPPTTARPRRALVTPFILATSGFFGEFLSGFTDIFDLRSSAVGAGGRRPTRGVGILFGLAVVPSLIFYVMLVFAPRQIAEREGTPGYVDDPLRSSSSPA